MYKKFCNSSNINIILEEVQIGNIINNIFLKLSLFAISIVLYFSLNTLFMTSSKMSNAYFDYENSGPIYVIINLFLPFIICTIIILLLK